LNLEKGIATRMAKRNEGQAIENKRFREIADSAPSMISMTCGADAKRLVSFGETNPFVFPIFGLVNARNETGVACRDGGCGPEGWAARMRSLDEAEGAKEVAQKST
jgi:hypothetical protein